MPCAQRKVWCAEMATEVLCWLTKVTPTFSISGRTVSGRYGIRLTEGLENPWSKRPGRVVVLR